MKSCLFWMPTHGTNPTTISWASLKHFKPRSLKWDFVASSTCPCRSNGAIEYCFLIPQEFLSSWLVSAKISIGICSKLIDRFEQKLTMDVENELEKSTLWTTVLSVKTLESIRLLIPGLQNSSSYFNDCVVRDIFFRYLKSFIHRKDQEFDLVGVLWTCHQKVGESRSRSELQLKSTKRFHLTKFLQIFFHNA